jgi:hypothetical protein
MHVIYGPPAECNTPGRAECNTLLHLTCTRVLLICEVECTYLLYSRVIRRIQLCGTPPFVISGKMCITSGDFAISQSPQRIVFWEILVSAATIYSLLIFDDFAFRIKHIGPLFAHGFLTVRYAWSQLSMTLRPIPERTLVCEDPRWRVLHYREV